MASTDPLNHQVNGTTMAAKNKDGRNGTKRVLCYPLKGAKSWIKFRKSGKKRKNLSQTTAAPPQPDSALTSSSNTLATQSNQNSISSEFRQAFDGLEEQQRNCLLSFALFPANAVVKKRLLVNWWIAEGFLQNSSTTGENTADELEITVTNILDNLIAQNLVVSVNNKRKKAINRFKTTSERRSQLIALAQERQLLNYSRDGSLVCLVTGKNIELKNQEKIRTLFNVNQRFLDFKFDSFSKMKNVQVLRLGMWQSSVEYNHIEVENTDFLKGLKYMVSLRLLSLEGISGIERLPSSISKARKLKFLHLRACHNLETLPKQIKFLKMLTYLDLSECFMLDHIPKEILQLPDLQVLKGFVINDVSGKENRTRVCTLAELVGLKKLRELSINVNSESFSVEEFSTLLFKFKELEKLHILWGGGSKAADEDQINKELKKQESAAGKRRLDRKKTMIERAVARTKSKIDRPETKLKKLDLQCYPQKKLPSWLNPDNLGTLKKLYIRGGTLTSLGEIKMGWNVEVLHLKYLSELKVDWSRLDAMFPNLNYLEKFKCPKVSFCPCDGHGVWRKS